MRIYLKRFRKLLNLEPSLAELVGGEPVIKEIINTFTFRICENEILKKYFGSLNFEDFKKHHER